MPANKKRSAKKQSTRTPKIHLQYGALPYRKSKTAGVEVLLVTSRETKRWIIPKGWPIKGLSPKKSAAREAYRGSGCARGYPQQADRQICVQQDAE